MFNLIRAATQQGKNHRYESWFMSPTGDFGLSPKVTKGLPKAFPLGNPPFKEITCIESVFGTCLSKRRILCHAAAPAVQHSKICDFFGVPCFCVARSLLLQILHTFGWAKVCRRRQNKVANRQRVDGRFVNRPYQSFGFLLSGYRVKNKLKTTRFGEKTR